jgi:hypothetical protein
VQKDFRGKILQKGKDYNISSGTGQLKKTAITWAFALLL